jgi:phytanoyl-CoA hydroxylase
VEQADTDVSFTATHSVMPEYLECVPIRMEPGDVLYFGGMTIHGSPPNRSANRFRRSFICHYRGVSHWPIIAPDILPEAG